MHFPGFRLSKTLSSNLKWSCFLLPWDYFCPTQHLLTGGIVKWCPASSRVKTTCKQEEKCPSAGHSKLSGLFAILRGRRRLLPEMENLLNRAHRSVSINFMIHMKRSLIFWLLFSSHQALRPQPNHASLQAHDKLWACKAAEGHQARTSVCLKIWGIISFLENTYYFLHEILSWWYHFRKIGIISDF